MIKKEDQKFCSECGNIINIKAEICPKCGVRVSNQPFAGINNKWLITLLLCIFFGGIGLHRFYNGHIITGIIQLLTLGGCGIWTLIDLVLIIIGSFKDADGKLIQM